MFEFSEKLTGRYVGRVGIGLAGLESAGAGQGSRGGLGWDEKERVVASLRKGLVCVATLMWRLSQYSSGSGGF